MRKELDKAIKDAMLAWLLNLDEFDRSWGHPWSKPGAAPVEVTGWTESDFDPFACSSCYDGRVRLTIHYRTEGGDMADFEWDDDFGEFTRELCA